MRRNSRIFLAADAAAAAAASHFTSDYIAVVTHRTVSTEFDLLKSNQYNAQSPLDTFPRSFPVANLLRTCYVETGVMDFGLKTARIRKILALQLLYCTSADR